PFLLVLGLDAGRPIDSPLDRAEDRREDRAAIEEDVRHIGAEGTGGGDDERKRDDDFEQTSDSPEHDCTLYSGSFGRQSRGRRKGPAVGGARRYPTPISASRISGWRGSRSILRLR